MLENVRKFFEIYDNDQNLRKRIDLSVAAYPGSLEIRDALVRDVLLPVAEEMGLGFTLTDLRVYETRKKLERSQGNVTDDGFEGYWLLERGWSSDEAKFCGDSK